MSDNLRPIEKRINLARTWKARLEKLIEKRQKKDPSYSEAEFCRIHGFDYGFFNRVKNLRSTPTQKTVDSIESALKKEKV